MANLKSVKIDKKNPHSALRLPAQAMPARHTKARTLSDGQLRNPLIRAGHFRLSKIVELRGEFLRRLDTVHGDRRSRIEKFTSLARASEQIFLRLDLATGVLGWLDEGREQFFLNTQRGIAEDAGISPASLSRLFSTLEDAGYVYRRFEKIRLDERDENGLHLVRTRVLIRFTNLFWSDLGLRFAWARAQKAAIKRREESLRAISQRRLARVEQAAGEQLRRERSRANWQSSERRKSSAKSSATTDSELNRHRTELIVAIAQERGISARQAQIEAELLIQSQITSRRRS